MSIGRLPGLIKRRAAGMIMGTALKELKKAVASVGDRADKVQAHLKGRAPGGGDTLGSLAVVATGFCYSVGVLLTSTLLRGMAPLAIISSRACWAAVPVRSAAGQ